MTNLEKKSKNIFCFVLNSHFNIKCQLCAYEEKKCIPFYKLRHFLKPYLSSQLPEIQFALQLKKKMLGFGCNPKLLSRIPLVSWQRDISEIR